MPDFLKLIYVASFVALGSTAIAQTTTETPTTQDQPATPDTPATDDTDAPTEDTDAPKANDLGLDPGVQVDGPGTIYSRETHGDWDLRCVRVQEGQKEPCKLYQLLKDEDENGVAEINFFNLPKGQQFPAGALVVTPLETLLTKQLTVGVDGGPTKRYQFTWCAADGCYSRIGFSNADIASFKRGSSAKVSIVPVVAPTQKVTLTLSLTGFTAGYDAMIKANTQ